MVGPTYDFLQNPLGAVRLTFEKAVSSSPPSDLDPTAVVRGKDWGVADLFNHALFQLDAIAQVPFLDESNLRSIKPNTLVRYRGMVQDMFGSELYIGAFKDGSTWKTNKFTDVASHPMPSDCETHLWERRLIHCVPIPGQNSWTLDSSASGIGRDLQSESVPQLGGKRQRDADLDSMDLNVSDNDRDVASSSKKQKEDESSCQSSQSFDGMMIHDSKPNPRSDSHSSESTSFSCLVKVYDMPENDVKLNDVFEFIGIYTFDPDLATKKEEEDPMYDLMEDVMAHLPPNKVPRIHSLICRKLDTHDFLYGFVPEMVPNMIRDIRESLLGHLTAVLGNDGLAAQCMLLHLLSRIRAKSEWISVGKMSLNLTSFTRESASIFGNKLIDTLRDVLPFSQAIPLTLEYLNTATLQPKKNNQTGRLVTGVLQLAHGTHLTIDETHMLSGMLNSNGVENAKLLQHLMESQKVEYDFEFYKLEMAADVQMLILSEGKSTILPADLVLPFRPTSISSQVIATDDQLQAWRWYLSNLRSLDYSNEPELLQTVQDEMVAAMKEDRSLGGMDLSRWLTMAQLISTSFGERSLSMESWQMAKELDRLRRERLK